MFLTRMGMQMRIEALKRAAKTEVRRDAIEKAAGRLVDTFGMGKEYQVLGVTCHGKSAGGDGIEDVVWPFESSP